MVDGADNLVMGQPVVHEPMGSIPANKIDDVAVIVRSANERTESLCRHIICQQVAEENVAVVREKPFSAALVKSFEIGLDIRQPWTLCVDADVLLTDDAIGQYRKEVSATRNDVLGLSGYLLDNFYGRKKRRGFHIYRTAHLGLAHKFAIKAASELRPETWTKEQMAAQGNVWCLAPLVYGIHDYEQSYMDIFRKMATRAQKSPADYDQLLARTKRESSANADFLVATWGLQFGASLSPDQVALHADQWADVANSLLVSHGLVEKPPLAVDTETARMVNDTIARHVADRATTFQTFATGVRTRIRQLFVNAKRMLVDDKSAAG